MARSSKPELCQLWRQRIDEQIQSGLSIPKFCQIHGIQTYNFYYWRRRLSPSTEQASPAFETGLVPIRIVDNQLQSHAKIQFASGATLEASADLMRIAIDQIIASERNMLGAKPC